MAREKKSADSTQPRSRVAWIPIFLACWALNGQPAQPPAAGEPFTVALTNPYRTGGLPEEISVSLCAENGKALRTVVCRVERGRITNIPAIAGASKLRVEAVGFEEVTIPISVARASGIALSPLASLTVEGLVSNTTEPMARPVKVWLRRKGLAEAVRKEARADQTGRFPLRLAAGDWDLVFQVQGLAPVTASELVSVGEQRALKLAAAGLGLRARLLVRDEKGQAIPNATVSWSLAGTPTLEDLLRQGKSRFPFTPPLLEIAVNSLDARTDSAGAILKQEIPDLPQAWTARAEGFRSQRLRLRQDPEKAQLELPFTLRPLPDLTVSIRDLTGQKVDLTLELARRPMESLIGAPYEIFWKGSVLAGASRQFSRIAEAEYRLDLKDSNGVLQTREALSPLDSDWSRPEIARSLVREPRTITGRITRGEAPVEGILFFPRLASPWPQVEDTLYPLDRLAEFASRSDPDGRFTILVGGHGRYVLDYSSPDSRVRGTTSVLDLTTERQASVEVLVPAGNIDVRVIDADGEQPVPDANLRIVVTLLEGTTQTLNHTDKNGDYSLGGVDPSAAVEIVASAKGFAAARREVRGTQVEPVVFSLRHAKGLLFHITDPFGAPIAGAEIRRPEPAQQIGKVGGAGYARTVARADSSGIAELEQAELGPRPYLAMAAGFQIEVVLASPIEGGSEASDVSVVLHRIEVGSSIALRTQDDRPVRSAALAFAKSGTVIPWGLMVEKATAEGGSPQALLLSDSQGSINSHQLLAPGEYQVFRYKPPNETDPLERFLPLGSLQLPLAAPALLTLPQLSKGENQ